MLDFKSKGWNPDPLWPEHIVGLCYAMATGEDVRFALKDALLEERLIACANEMERGNHIVGSHNWNEFKQCCICKSHTVGIILADKHRENDRLIENEILEYLNKRRLNSNIL